MTFDDNPNGSKLAGLPTRNGLTVEAPDGHI